MLKSITVSNFRAFEKSVTLDFSNIGNYEFNKDALKNNIVKTAIMYGKNASGKSSIALAIFDIVASLTDNYNNNTRYLSYQNAKNISGDVCFEFCFEILGKNIVYKYRKQSLREIVAEALFIDGNVALKYDKEKSSKIVINIKGAENFNVKLNELQISLLKAIKSNCVLSGEDNRTLSALFEFVNKMLLFWSLEDRGFVGYEQFSLENIFAGIVEKIVKSGHFEDLKRFFKEAGFTDELIHKKGDNNREWLFIKVGETALNFQAAASTGMSSLLLVYYWLEDIKDAKKAPSFICIDEFDAFYHFELSRFIVEKLKNYNCQILLTTHNTALLANNLLRPDCYYICTKDKIVNVHNATDKELREGHNLEKLYRGGAFEI